MARYFVGNGTNWSSTSSWATSTGGASGAAVPTSTDDVFLDGNSPGNLTIDVAASCQSLNCTGFTHSLTHTAAITLSIGSATAGASNVALLLVSGMTYTLGSTTTSAISFVSTSTTQQTITFGGKSTGNLTFNGAGGSWQFESSMTQAAATTVLTLTQGSLDINSQTCSGGGWSTNGTLTRSLSLEAASVSLTPSVGSGWLISNTTGLTFNAGTSTITINGANNYFTGGGLTYNNVVLASASAGATNVQGSNTFANLTVTQSAVQAQATFQHAATQTVTGTFTITGNSVSSHSLLSSDALGLSATINAAAVSLSNVDIMDIIGAGAATWSGTSLGNLGGNSNITFTTAVTRYWVATAGGSWNATTSWSTSTGGSSGATVPLPQDTAVFDGNSVTATGKTIILNTASYPTVDFTNVTNSPTVQFTMTNCNPNINGNLKLISGLTVTASGNATWNLSGRGPYSLTTAGNTIPMGLQIQAPNGTYTSQDNLTINGPFNLIAGTYSANNLNVSCTTFTTSNSNTRTLTMGSGTWTVSSTGNVWNVATTTNLTYQANTATIVVSDTSATSKTLFTSSLTYHNVTISGGTGANIFSVGNSTFNTITINAPATVEIVHNTTQTISNLVATGTSGNLITITSDSAGNQATLSKAAGVISCNYLSLKDSKAIGGANWYAGANSTNVSDNTGWVFLNAEAGNSTFFMVGGI